VYAKTGTKTKTATYWVYFLDKLLAFRVGRKAGAA
jgi:hypothetical protein